MDNYFKDSNIELLAPGGSLEAIQAAVHAGADAVYFGVGNLNARANAQNIEIDQITEIVTWLHMNSARAYLALNILLLNNEMNQALTIVESAYGAGIDGIIVQDIGLASMIRKKYPDLPLHASTQMTISDKAGLIRAVELGFSRVVLPRELHLETIRELSEYARSSGIEIEVFVHGALCISYSGQCLMSGLEHDSRSANRGQCAQPCRLNYSVSQYGAANASGNIIKSNVSAKTEHPLISPRDQALIDYLPQLAAAGVFSLKIEGRMRGSDYVALVVSEYRTALDKLMASQSYDADYNKLLLAFNRGGSFTRRYLLNDKSSDFLTGDYPGSFGMKLGEIKNIDISSGTLSIFLSEAYSKLPVKGDIISVRRNNSEVASAPAGKLQLYDRQLGIKGFHPDIMRRMRPGDLVFLMSDNDSLDKIRKQGHRDTQVSFKLVVSYLGREKIELLLEAEIISGIYAGKSFSQNRRCDKAPVLVPFDRIEKQLKKTGGTGFSVKEVNMSGCINPELSEIDAAYLPVAISDINGLRRDLLKLIKNEFAKSPAVRKDCQTNYKENSCMADNSHAQTEARDRVRIDAWYQRLPDEPSDIACGADCYILPLLGLTNENAGNYVDAIRRIEEDCVILVWLPPAPLNEIAGWVEDSMSNLHSWGINGVASGHLGIRHLIDCDTHLEIDTTANITNSAAYCEALRLRPNAIACSDELNFSQIREIISGIGDFGLEKALESTNIVLPIYGRQRLMSSAFCPVGQNQAQCRKCYLQETDIYPDQAKMYNFIDRKKQRHILQTHPRFCTMDLLSSWLRYDEIMLVGQGSFASVGINTSLRLYFMTETSTEKRRLINLIRAYNKSLKKEDQERFLAEIRKHTAAIADSVEAELKTGRRNIYGKS
jgi:putative protease